MSDSSNSYVGFGLAKDQIDEAVDYISQKKNER